MVSLYTQISTALSTVSSTAHDVGNKIVSKACNRTTMGNMLRVYNAVTAAAVLTNYMTNKEESSNEYLFDIAVHLLQAGVSDNSPDFLRRVAEGVNLLRISSIGYYQLTGTSTIPTVANYADLLNHGSNFAYLLTSTKR